MSPFNHGSLPERGVSHSGKGTLFFEACRNGDSKSQGTSFCWSDTSAQFCTYPLKLILPRTLANSPCRWIYPMMFGGGFVCGDTVDLEISLNENCCVVLASQSYPKVYTCKDGGMCRQTCRFTIGNEALLCILPEILVCFKDADYRQYQRIDIAPSGNVVFLDWFLSGRIANDERWDFKRLESSLEVYQEEKLILREAMDLHDTSILKLKQSMGTYNVIGICVILGPWLSDLVKESLSVFNAREEYGQKAKSDVIFAASPVILSDNDVSGCVIRFASETSPQAYSKINSLLSPLFPLFGGSPFHFCS